MTRRPVWLFVLVVLLAASAALAQAAGAPAAAPPVDIPRLEKIVIDGSPDDWGDGGFRVPALLPSTEGIRPIDQSSAALRLGWDEKGLLVLVTVVERSPYEDMELYWQADSLQLYYSIHPAWDVELLVSPGITKDTPDLKGRIWHWINWFVAAEDLSYEAARTRTSDGYVVEVRLPWANLPDFHAQAGAELGFRLAHNDQLPEDKTVCGHYVTVWDPTTILDHSRGVRLADQASPMPTLCWAAHGACQSPRVSVVGPLGLAGKRVEVRQGGAVLAARELSPHGQCAVAEVILPFPPPQEPIGQVEVVVDGRPVGTATLAGPTNKQFILAAVTGTSATAPASSRFRLAPAGVPPYDAIDGVTARVRATDLAGNAVATVDAPINQEFALPLAPGLYRITARVEDFHGRALEAGNTCLVGTDRKCVDDVVARARELAAQERFAEASAPLDYLSAKVAAADPNAPLSDEVLQAAVELGECVCRLESGKSLLADMRGSHEWAYRSAIDGTAQPFTIHVPDDYDSNTPRALLVWLHGSGSTHVPQKTFPGILTVWVLGRSTTGGYAGLSETDVLEAIDYVQAHWNVDPDRVHLMGGSMGGGGAFWIGSRHADRFATVSSLCGYGIFCPLENLLGVPFYSLHSQDDPRVPVIASRAAVNWLASHGGVAVAEEPTGYGHGITKYAEGVERNLRWLTPQVRNTRPTRVRYAATDEAALGAWWVRVVEWGPDSARLATIDARVGPGNTLCVDLANVRTARLNLADSPADANTPMLVAVNGHYLKTLPAPLPDELYATRQDSGQWQLSSRPPAAPSHRLHFPGGAMALYHGQPMMVVWGTRGDAAITAKLAEIAKLARRTCDPAWSNEDGRQALFGRLPGKSDTDVTPEDMARYNLLLIGSAEQNAVVARLAPRLPVRQEGDRFVTDDGQSWPADGRAIGLLYYNPEAPRRLIYWVAGDSADFYAPEAPLMKGQRHGDGPDLVIMEGKNLLAARRFDSRWNWQAGYADSPRVPDDLCSTRELLTARANAVRRQAGADFSAMFDDEGGLTAGQTRRMDLLATIGDPPIGVADVTGRQLLELQTILAGHKRHGSLVPRPGDDLPPDRLYRLALDVGILWDIASSYPPAASTFRLTDDRVLDAVDRHLFP